MTSDTLLTKAKSQLTSKYPYFGMLASRLKHESNEKVRFYASNGVVFKYNPEFIDKCSIDELIFILTNCVMHHILAHSQRKLKRKGFLWQLATDYAINNLLKKMVSKSQRVLTSTMTLKICTQKRYMKY